MWAKKMGDANSEEELRGDVQYKIIIAIFAEMLLS
jgi:hypothetical protein